MKFKVGDRVRRKVISNTWVEVFGDQTDGTVTYVDGDDILIDNKKLLW